MTPTRWCEPPKSPEHKAAEDALIPATAGRVWFWEPSWYWHGWSTLLPVRFGMSLGDEYGRKTMILGWTITGRAIVVLKTCYCDECCESREQTNRFRTQGLAEGWWED